jgi:hypothetical protein
VAGSAALPAPDWVKGSSQLVGCFSTLPQVDEIVFKNDPESVPMGYLKPVRHMRLG